MRLGSVGAACHVDRDQVRRPFAVGGNGLSQFHGDLADGFGDAARSSAESCLGPAAPLASNNTVSLVLMWPSTLMQLKLSATAADNID